MVDGCGWFQLSGEAGVAFATVVTVSRGDQRVRRIRQDVARPLCSYSAPVLCACDVCDVEGGGVLTSVYVWTTPEQRECGDDVQEESA